MSSGMPALTTGKEALLPMDLHLSTALNVGWIMLSQSMNRIWGQCSLSDIQGFGHFEG